MDYQAVKSSNVAAIGYDPAARELGVRFKTGASYIFKEVPPSLHQQMLAAKSAGGFFAAHVRGRFESIKIEPAHAEERRESRMD